MRSTVLITLLIGLLMASCQSHKSGLTSLSHQKKYCQPTIRLDYDSSYLPIPNIQSILQTDTSLTNHFSTHDLLVANAAGILLLLQDFIRLKNTSLAGNVQERFAKRQQINDRLWLASMQVSGIAGELDCEAERANRLASSLQQLDSKRIQQLTIFSVVVGALTTVATAFIQANTPNKTVSIGGGVASALLAGKAAVSSKRTIHLVDERNLLTAIWNQPQRSTFYPPFVWQMLTEKALSYGGQHSISYNTRQRWVDYNLAGASASEEQLYFKPEGDYGADNLLTRAEMLNQLQAEIRLFYVDLQSLHLSLSNQR
ncbi:hypothetical protein [Spirosoma fluviale]|uniref:Uncharacterized protein n=1 Tax=Spirosoma fluviale TaxID=1597977 RepID=A0A286GS29_9BACT|nr:hypothetical protein [Spirosoma fluviale]SOD97986.1 hypothetical protein SAMN06269250_5988 [Spirosoma fluviale]